MQPTKTLAEGGGSSLQNFRTGALSVSVVMNLAVVVRIICRVDFAGKSSPAHLPTLPYPPRVPLSHSRHGHVADAAAPGKCQTGTVATLKLCS